MSNTAAQQAAAETILKEKAMELIELGYSREDLIELLDEAESILRDEATEEIDPDTLYVQHLENAGYWEAREEEDRYGYAPLPADQQYLEQLTAEGRI